MDRNVHDVGATRLWNATTWPFITSVLVLMTFIAFEAFAVTTVLPGAMADLEGSSWYSLAFAATISTGLVGMIIGGNWADRSGPRRPLVVGGTLFLLGIALCVIAPHASVFILGRFLQGIGGGIDSVVLYVLIARQIPDGARPKMFGLLSAAWLVPSMAGPLLAGTLADLTSWRTVFALILLGSALALGGLLRATRSVGQESAAADGPDRIEDRERPPIIGRKGAVAVMAAGILVVLHFSAQLKGPLALTVLLLGLIALAVTGRALLPPGTLRLRGLAQRLVVLRAGLGVASTVSDVYLTLFLQSERGISPTIAGLVIASGAGGWALGSWIQSRRGTTQHEHRRLILLATPLVAAAPLGALALTLDLVPLAVVVATSVAKGLGMGIASARIATATLALAPVREQGMYSSALQAGESMAVAATTAVMALILSSALTGTGPYVLVYAVLLALAALSILIAGSSPRISVRADGDRSSSLQSSSG